MSSSRHAPGRPNRDEVGREQHEVRRGLLDLLEEGGVLGAEHEAAKARYAKERAERERNGK